jgi:hypothetical protein
MFLLHTLGHSVVYHSTDGDCNRGIKVPVEEFAARAEFPEDELEPCTRCYPPLLGDVEPGTRLELEILRHTVTKCRDADAVVERLKRPSKETCWQCHGKRVFPPYTRQLCGECSGRGYINGDPVLSAPGQRLLELVKNKDTDIARAYQATVTL